MGHTLLGLGFLLFAIYQLIKSNDYLNAGITLLLVLFFGFIISFNRVRVVKPDIAVSISKNQTTAETKYAHDGGAFWIPFSGSAPIILGIAVNSFTRGLDWQNILYITTMGFGSGFVLAIGLTYMYWEYKYNRKIKVYRYQKTKAR